MIRPTLFTVAALLAACGVDAPSPVTEAPLTLVEAAPPTMLEVRAVPLSAQLQTLRPAGTVQVHSLAAPDGAEVHYLLGVMSCGLLVVADGVATVQGGAFEIPYDPAAAAGLDQVSLYYQVVAPGAACQEGQPIFEVTAALPGSVDLTAPPEPSYVGCWLFSTQP